MPDYTYEVTLFSEASFYSLLSFPLVSSGILRPDEKYRSSRQEYLFRYLTNLGTRTIIAEHNYIDGDYLEDFSSYYVRCHKTYASKCTRLHFFSHEINENIFLDLITRQLRQKDINNILYSYNGFIVAKPLPNAQIGRTLLATYPNNNYSATNNKQSCYTAIREYKPNLFGITLSVKSLPFQEQDNVLAACATVSLWSAFHKTADLFGSLAPRPAEITRAANAAGGNSRAVPSQGLSIGQMANAVRSVGLEPELIIAAPDLPLISVIYSYLKHGLPVVLGVSMEGQEGLHAVTLVGFSTNEKQVIRSEVASDEINATEIFKDKTKSTPSLIGLRIDNFYAHDDQIGPFSELKVRDSDNDSVPVLFEGRWPGDNGNNQIMTPKWILVPIYNKIRVGFPCIQKCIMHFWTVLESVLEKKYGEETHEWDVYLIKSVDLKNELTLELRDDARLIPFLVMQQPRFVWRVSLKYGDKKILEVLGDATDIENACPFFEIIWFDSEIAPSVHEALKDGPIGEMPIVVFNFLKGTSKIAKST